MNLRFLSRVSMARAAPTASGDAQRRLRRLTLLGKF